jgi:hypothetical protein
VEGSHRTLKQYITTSSGDLYATYKRLMQFWNNQHEAWAAKLAASKSRIPVAAQASHFVNLIGLVTNFALNRIQAQVIEVQKEQGSIHCPDTCLYPIYWGLPCQHYLRSLMRKDKKGNVYFKPIDLGKIHPHWLYHRARGCYMQRASAAPFPILSILLVNQQLLPGERILEELLILTVEGHLQSGEIPLLQRE